jgi:uncharacterized protein
LKNKYILFFVVIFKLESSNMHNTYGSSFQTMEPGVQRSYLLNEFRICSTDVTADALGGYLEELVSSLGFQAASKGSFVFINEDVEDEHNLEAIFSGKAGGIRIYYWRRPRLLVVDVNIFGKEVEAISELVGSTTKKHFGLIESAKTLIKPKNVKQENLKIEVRCDHELGRGIFVKEDIFKGEFIGGLYGKFHEAKDCMSLPEQYRDHVMQCGENIWRGNEFENAAVQYLNHSCDPNCGVQGLFDFVAMKDIKAGQEIVTDYSMQDDSNWEVPGGVCLCGAKDCRGKILPYRELSQKDKDNYKDYVSHWILHRYKICSCNK